MFPSASAGARARELAPLLGEDTEEILLSELEIDRARFAPAADGAIS